MDGWTDEWMEEWKNGWMDGCMDGVDGWMEVMVIRRALNARAC